MSPDFLLTFITADDRRAHSLSIYAHCLEDTAIFPSLFRDCSSLPPARQETGCLSSGAPPKRCRRGGQTRMAELEGRDHLRVTATERRRGRLRERHIPGNRDGGGKQSLGKRGAGRARPRGEPCPNQPRGEPGDEAAHDMSHSPEPKPCVSAAGERQPARGLGRARGGFLHSTPSSRLRPCLGRGRGVETRPAPSPPSPVSRAAPAALVEGHLRGAGKGLGVMAVRVSSVWGRLTGGATVTGRAGLTAPGGRGAARRALPPSRPRAGPPSSTPPHPPAAPRLGRRSPAGTHLLSSAASPPPPARPPRCPHRAGARPRPGGPTRGSGGRRGAHARHPGGGAGRCGGCRPRRGPAAPLAEGTPKREHGAPP